MHPSAVITEHKRSVPTCSTTLYRSSHSSDLHFICHARCTSVTIAWFDHSHRSLLETLGSIPQLQVLRNSIAHKCCSGDISSLYDSLGVSESSDLQNFPVFWLHHGTRRKNRSTTFVILHVLQVITDPNQRAVPISQRVFQNMLPSLSIHT